jgi:hypothetical protein
MRCDHCGAEVLDEFCVPCWVRNAGPELDQIEKQLAALRQFEEWEPDPNSRAH